jgi:hypothetical protein
MGRTKRKKRHPDSALNLNREGDWSPESKKRAREIIEHADSVSKARTAARGAKAMAKSITKAGAQATARAKKLRAARERRARVKSTAPRKNRPAK